MITRFGFASLLLLGVLVAGCSLPAPPNSPPSTGQGSPLLVPMERARKAAAEVEARQQQQEKAVMEAGR